MTTSTPWSSVGYLTYKRTYSRRLEPDNLEGPTEEWHDTINRVINATRSQLNCGFTEAEELRLRDHMMQLRGTVAGRFLWQLGTPTVDRLGLPSLQNCAACVVDHPIRPFTWAMDRLMLGVGVGFNIQKEYVFKLPPVREDFIGPIRHDEEDADFIVPDTREGWVSLLEKTLKSGFYADEKIGFTFSTQLIRGKGAPIKGFGGVASGPEDLCWGIGEIGKVLQSRAGKQLRPIDCLDIMNIIGAVVVAGNVRRSAQIAIGDSDDIQFLKAKNWSEGNIPNWRANSNNSVVCNDIRMLPEEFWQTYLGGSEPYGLINMKLSRSVGRLGETEYPDKKVVAYNPCLHPDTLVETTEGRVRIADMNRPYMVYSMDDDGSLVARKSSPSWISKKNTKTIKIKINSGNELICTPDHKIYSAERGWVEAKDLMKGERIVHLSRTRIGVAYSGIRLTSQNVSEQKMEHRFVWESVNGNIPDDHDIHHIDGDTFNNHIDNLQCLSHSDHSSLTRYECPNDHQVWGPDGNFISNGSSYVKPIKNVPEHMRTGLFNSPMVVSIEEHENSDVYDITVEGTHNFVAENIIVHNCAEQSLENFETCCLAETFLPNITSKEQLQDVVTLLYRVNKHSLRLHDMFSKETQEVVNRNMRMGIGITGYLQATEEQRSWLSDCYVKLREFDKEYSAARGWPISIKLTTCKPSGTLSLLPGVTPGVHPGYARFMIRRIRVASNHPIVNVCKEHGYRVEYVRRFDGTDDYGTVVVEFPFSYPEGTKLAAETSAFDQLDFVRRLQTEWSDNSVSCTVYYREEELPAIKEYLKKHWNKGFKSLSFLLHSGHGFDQAPFEEISEERFNSIVAKTRLITNTSAGEMGMDMDSECASGVCPVR